MAKYRFDQVARECRTTFKGDKNGMPIVGLEHLVPNEMLVRDFEVDTENTFTKSFKQGQILFGRRRAYQQKAGVAQFDGICSGDITVIEAIPGKIEPNLLPFIVQNEQFFEHAVQGSAGSLSPRVKWEHLASYEIELPTMEKQRVLADKLWTAYRLKESYKKLLAATDEMVKSQFIEMFGDPMTNTKGWTEYGYIGNYSQIVLGSTPNSKNPSYWDGDIKWITPAEMTDESYYIYDTERHLTEEGLRSTNLTLLPYGSVLFSTRAPIGKVGLVGSPMYCNQGFKNFICNDNLNPVYLYYTLIYKHDYLVSLGTGTTFKELSKKAVDNLEIAIPPLELQEQFECIYHQSDKSKFVGFKSQFIEMFGNPLSDVQKYGLKKLGECCELNPRRPRLNLEDSDMVSFVPMPSVSENGHLVDVADEEYGKVKKGFTYFENNDVLFAKITPCMENGKGTIAQDLTNGIGMGSTEFHVLRPINNISNAYWLLALTRMPIFRERASKNMSGTGGQKRVGAAFLENFLVGLPPIGEQQAFEAIYKQADKSKLVGHCSMNAMNVEISKLINKKISII